MKAADTNAPLPLWLGCDVFAWARLLAANRFAVHRSRWPIALVVSMASICHTMLRFVQQTACGGSGCRAEVKAPVFILGHWRAGTTLLHELLACDPCHAFPSTFECFAPHDFLIAGSWLPGLLGWLMPRRRPMDNMAAGWDRPQEDEFALCLLGQPSPYRRIAFPNRPCAAELDLGVLSHRQRQRWKAALLRFLRELTFAKGGRRLILKSPPHTCRIPTLLEMFPDAHFVHIIRDPYDLYPSTLHLWRSLYTLQGLQRPNWVGLQAYILETFTHLYDRFEEGKRLIPPGQFHEVRYEDLVRDPAGNLEAMYRALRLGDFTAIRPHVEAYLADVKDYQTNRYLLTAEEQRLITQRWGDVIRRYGYAIRSS
jgi:hypothetical protein